MLKSFSRVKKNLKKSNRGSFVYVVDYNSGTTILWWFDNNSVQLIVNYVGNGLGKPARRWGQKNTRYIQVQRPKMVEIGRSFLNSSLDEPAKKRKGHQQFPCHMMIFV